MNRNSDSSKSLSSQLPDYLGFGCLKPNSISGSTQELYAEYRAGDELVYSVWISERGCRLEEFFEGQSLAVCEQPTLMEAFFRDPSLYSPIDHPRLKQLISQLTQAGNIKFILPKRVRYLYFPSGLIFYLYLPIHSGNHIAWEALKHQEALRGEASRLHFPKLQHEWAHVFPTEETWNHDHIEIVEFTTLLIELEEMCNLLSNSRVILREEAYPLLVRLNRLDPGDQTDC